MGEGCGRQRAYEVRKRNHAEAWVERTPLTQVELPPLWVEIQFAMGRMYCVDFYVSSNLGLVVASFLVVGVASVTPDRLTN